MPLGPSIFLHLNGRVQHIVVLSLSNLLCCLVHKLSHTSELPGTCWFDLWRINLSNCAVVVHFSIIFKAHHIDYCVKKHLEEENIGKNKKTKTETKTKTKTRAWTKMIPQKKESEAQTPALHQSSWCRRSWEVPQTQRWTLWRGPTWRWGWRPRWPRRRRACHPCSRATSATLVFVLRNISIY